MTQLLSINIHNSELDNFKAIHRVVDMVEWDEVHKVMKYLDWKWASSEGVPEIYELKESALRLAEEAVADTIKYAARRFIATGGIEVDTEFYEETGCVYLKVNFVVSGYDNLL